MSESGVTAPPPARRGLRNISPCPREVLAPIQNGVWAVQGSPPGSAPRAAPTGPGDRAPCPPPRDLTVRGDGGPDRPHPTSQSAIPSPRSRPHAGPMSRTPLPPVDCAAVPAIGSSTGSSLEPAASSFPRRPSAGAWAGIDGPGPARALSGFGPGGVHLRPAASPGLADPVRCFPFEHFRRARFGDRPPRCPHCEGRQVHRWGSFAHRRRYRCLDCGRTFSDFTGTPLAYLKLVDRWPAFCHCALHSQTVRHTARRLGVNKDTAFRWRHRLLAALVAAERADPGVHALRTAVMVHETVFPFSAKGRRRPDPSRSAPPRTDRPRVWVCIARDLHGRTVTGVVGSRRPTAIDLDGLLRPRLANAPVLVSVAGPYGAAGLLAVRLQLRYLRAPSVSPAASDVRGYVLSLRRWLARFRGVASRYLHHYLAWHRILSSADPAPLDHLLLGLVHTGHARYRASMAP